MAFAAIDNAGGRQSAAMGVKGDKPAGLGWDSALMPDGGGSFQCDFVGEKVTSGREVHSLVLAYLKKGGAKPPEEDCMDCAEKLVNVALGELGHSEPSGDDRYIAWYNKAMGEKLPLSVSWCAIFVSWCARQAGVCAGAIPNYASCTAAVNTFKKVGIWKPRGSYTPKRGDLIFFDWDRDPGVSEHTGIVTGVDNGCVQTVEGNSGTPGAVRVKSYALNSVLVLGYAAWVGEAVAEVPTQDASPVKTAQAELNGRYKAGLSADGSWGPASRKAAVRAAQTEINAVYKKNLAVDGFWGPACKAACPTLRQGEVNNLVWVLQLLLTAKEHPVDRDRSYGPGTAAAVKAFQGEKNLNVDAMAGSAVFTALLQ